MTKTKVVGLPHPRKAREAKGFSQRGLANLVGTSQVMVCRWERRGTYPKQKHLRSAFLAALGLSESK